MISGSRKYKSEIDKLKKKLRFTTSGMGGGQNEASEEAMKQIADMVNEARPRPTAVSYERGTPVISISMRHGVSTLPSEEGTPREGLSTLT